MADHTNPDAPASTDGAGSTYPFLAGPPQPGELHLRGYADDAGNSRLGDLAAMAAALVADGFHTVVGCAVSSRSSFVGAAALGWREPLLDVTHAEDLLGVTAALYRAWAKGIERPIAVLVDDFMALETAPEGGHDDHIALAWVNGVCHGDASRLATLTGLDFAAYTGRMPTATTPRPEGGAPVMLVLGGRYRKLSESRPPLHAMMGGAVLLHHASSVTRITATDYADNMVGGIATLDKNHRGRCSSAKVVRSMDPCGPWRALS